MHVQPTLDRTNRSRKSRYHNGKWREKGGAKRGEKKSSRGNVADIETKDNSNKHENRGGFSSRCSVQNRNKSIDENQLTDSALSEQSERASKTKNEDNVNTTRR